MSLKLSGQEQPANADFVSSCCLCSQLRFGKPFHWQSFRLFGKDTKLSFLFPTHRSSVELQAIFAGQTPSQHTYHSSEPNQQVSTNFCMMARDHMTTTEQYKVKSQINLFQSALIRANKFPIWYMWKLINTEWKIFLNICLCVKILNLLCLVEEQGTNHFEFTAIKTNTFLMINQSLEINLGSVEKKSWACHFSGSAIFWGYKGINQTKITSDHLQSVINMWSTHSELEKNYFQKQTLVFK